MSKSLSVVDIITMKFEGCVMNTGKVREYNLLGLLRDYVEKDFPIAPSFAIYFSKDEIASFLLTREAGCVNTDLFSLIELLDMSYDTGNGWKKIINARFPLLRQTRHTRIGDSVVVKAFNVEEARRRGINYAHVKADGVLCTTFYLLLENQVKVHLAYTANVLHLSRMVVPMAGELCDDKFIIQCEYEFDMLPPVLSVGGAAYKVFAAEQLPADATECIASMEGVEYKFKNVPTVEIDLTKHVRFLNAVNTVLDGKAVVVYDCPLDVTGVAECAIKDGNYVFEKLRPDKLKGQTSLAIRQIRESTTYDEIKKGLSEKVEYHVYYPDWKVVQDFNDYLYANQEHGLASSYVFDHFVATSDTFVHESQAKRIKEANGWNTARFVTVAKLKEKKKCNFLLQHELRDYVIKSCMTLPPGVFCDVVANRLSKYVSMKDLLMLCSAGELLYIRNDVTALTVAGKTVNPIYKVPDSFFSAIILFYMRNKGDKKAEAANVSLFEMIGSFLAAHGDIGDENKWEKFIFANSRYYGLAKCLALSYQINCCVGQGVHICSYGGKNHEAYIGVKPYLTLDDGSFVHGYTREALVKKKDYVISKLETYDPAERCQYQQRFPTAIPVEIIAADDYTRLYSVLHALLVFYQDTTYGDETCVNYYSSLGELYGLSLRQLRYGKHFDI